VVSPKCFRALGDRWSLLIVRDRMLRNFRTYSHERIATNILADRLRKLENPATC